MTGSSRRQHLAFRPIVGDVRLEERVVLSPVPVVSTGAPEQFPTVITGATQVGQASAGLQTSSGQLSMRQIALAYREQLASTFGALQQSIHSEVAALYANPSNFSSGRLTASALADFQANVNGALNAAALRTSAQASLLPGSSNRLVPNLQSALLGNQRNSLSSRIAQLTSSGRLIASNARLQSALNASVRQSLASNLGQISRFLTTTPVNRLSVDATTGQPIPLSQFMANQAMNQINNAFGALANATISNGQSALFGANGVFNNQASAAFQQQFNTALGTAVFQAGSVLSLFPSASTRLSAGIQSSLFATGINPATGLPNGSFANALASTIGTGTSSLTNSGFNTGFQNGFTTAFQNLTTPLNSFLGLTPTTATGGTFQLPNGFFQANSTFPSVFGSQFMNTAFNGGFNNGFQTTGTGFPGFGTAPTSFNTNFATGFNNFATGANQQFGLSGSVPGATV